MTRAVLPVAAARGRSRLWLGILICLAIIVGLGLYNAVRGEPNVNVGEVWRAIVDPQPVAQNPAHFLIRELRIPRVLLGILCGLALGLVGVLLHDLNHAAAFSDQMVVLNHGAIAEAGEPWSILQPDLLHEVFGVHASVISEPQSGKPLIVAHSSARRRLSGG